MRTSSGEGGPIGSIDFMVCSVHSMSDTSKLGNSHLSPDKVGRVW